MTGDPGSSARVRRRSLLAGAGAACLLALAEWEPGGSRPEGARAKHLERVDPHAVTWVQTSDPVVALTFDDGPDPAYTPDVLAILDEFGVPATFFMIGRAATAHPRLVAQVRRAGHAIGNHTADHLWLDGRGGDEVAAQIRGGDTALGALGVPTPSLFRPPRGLTSPMVAAQTTALGKRTCFWGTSIEGDLPHHSPEVTAALNAARLRPGSIILGHDGGHLDGPNPQRIDRSRTVRALPDLIRLTRLGGFEFVTLPDLLSRGIAH